MNPRSLQFYRDQHARGPGGAHPSSLRFQNYRNALAQLAQIVAPSLPPGTPYQDRVVNRDYLYRVGPAKPLPTPGENDLREDSQNQGGSRHIHYHLYPKYNYLQRD